MTTWIGDTHRSSITAIPVARLEYPSSHSVSSFRHSSGRHPKKTLICADVSARSAMAYQSSYRTSQNASVSLLAPSV
jgi:hypothetical protein